jgi:hypothetical protein
MSDERQAFEQLHSIPSGAIWCEKRHIYIHKNYSGLVLHPINESWEAFCEGVMWQAARAGQAVSVPNESIDRDRLVDAVYLDLGRRFDFNLDSPLDMVAYLVDSGLISTAATPTKAGERQ